MIQKLYSALPIQLAYIWMLALLVTAMQVINQYLLHVSAAYDYAFSYGFVTIKSLINNASWVVLLPLVYEAVERFRAGIKPFQLRSLLFALLLIGIPLMHRSISLFLYNYAFSFKSGHIRSFLGPNNLTDLSGGYFLSVVEMVVVVAVMLAMDYQKRLANKEKDLARAQLNALKMQLHPHFLFNTLHSISSMIDLDTKEAQRMITRVGDLFRALLEREEKDLVTLGEEMSFVQNYLQLEHIRFQDRLKLNIRIEAANNALVPSMILQPIIENCIKYGVSKQAEGSYIDIHIRTQPLENKSEMLLIRVVNGSESPLATTNNGFGVGQKNVVRRLAQSYQDQFECSFERVDPYTYQSTLLIPLQYDQVGDNR